MLLIAVTMSPQCIDNSVGSYNYLEMKLINQNPFLLVLSLLISPLYADNDKIIDFEQELQKAKLKAEQQALLAEDMLKWAKIKIVKKQYDEAEDYLFKITNFLEPNTRTWPIILDASVLINSVNLAKAKDALAYKDKDLASSYVDSYFEGLFSDRDIQGDPNSFGRPGLVKTHGQKALEILVNEGKELQKLIGQLQPKSLPYKSNTGFIGKKLRIPIPGVQFFESPLPEVLNELERQAKAFDLTEPSHQKKGINLILLANGDKPFPKVTITLNSMPLGQMIHFITEMIKWDYEVRSDSVAVYKSHEVLDVEKHYTLKLKAIGPIDLVIIDNHSKQDPIDFKNLRAGSFQEIPITGSFRCYCSNLENLRFQIGDGKLKKVDAFGAGNFNWKP